MTGLTVGVAGVHRQGCVAVSDTERILGVCEQERITRVRGAGCNASGLPDEALDTILRQVGRNHDEVSCYATAEAAPNTIDGRRVEHIDHHLAHACAAYLSSPFSNAITVVCDSTPPK